VSFWVSPFGVLSHLGSKSAESFAFGFVKASAFRPLTPEKLENALKRPVWWLLLSGPLLAGECR